MDLDRYIAFQRPGWDRLEQLSGAVQSRPGSLSPAEVDEFVSLHHRTSGQLAHVRSVYRDANLNAELTSLVGRSNAALYRRTSAPGSGLKRFFTVSFPASVWHTRRAIGVSALAMFIPWIVFAIWLGTDPDALNFAIPEEAREAIVASEFEDYYSSAPASEFATSVLINNIQVSFTAYALGITFGVGTLLILAYNGVNVGVMNGVFIAAGQQGTFWGLITPHGLLEISAILIAGGAGLSMGWALVRPGDRTRSAAFGEEARRSAAVILGLTLAFVVAGLIEGFVTPGLPLWPRVSVGVVVELAFVTYIVSFGRRAEANGFTGLITEVEERASAASALSL